MKKIVSLLLALAMLLSMGVASAELYVPGEVNSALVLDAFNAGKYISYKGTASMDMDAAALGVAEDQTAALKEALAAMVIEAGVVKIENGARVDAAFTLDGVSIDGAIDVTLDGVTLRSERLMPGKGLFIGWQSLLVDGLGLDEATAAMAVELLHTDWETALPQMAQQLSAAVQQIGAVLAPYADAVVNYVGTLEPQLITDVAEEDLVPYADKAIVYTFGSKEIAGVLTALLDVLEKDEFCLPLFKKGFCEGVGMSTSDITDEELCAALRQMLDELAAEEMNPALFVMGFDEDNRLLYCLLQITESGEQLRIYIGKSTLGEGDMAYITISDAATGALTDGFVFNGSASAVTETEPGHVKGELSIVSGGEMISAALNVTVSAFTTNDGLPGLKTEGSMSMNVLDEAMLVAFTDESSLNANGGETEAMTMTYEMPLGYGQSVSVEAAVNAMSAKSGDDFAMVTETSYTMPEAGIKSAKVTSEIVSSDYAGLPDVELVDYGTSSDEELNALGETVNANGEAWAAEFEAVFEKYESRIEGE